MATEDFFATFFPSGFWETIARTPHETDDASFFGDVDTFRALIEKFRPQTIIEVGSWKGHSANFMADLCRGLGIQARILCIDTFLGSAEHWVFDEMRQMMKRQFGHPTIYENFLGNTIARGNTDMVFPLTLDSGNASGVLPFWQFKADMIYIDGAHDYPSVTADLTRFLPLLAERGVMFGDDYQEPQTANAVHDFAAARGLSVLVSERKWVLVTPGVLESLFGPSFVARTSIEGWIHP